MLILVALWLLLCTFPLYANPGDSQIMTWRGGRTAAVSVTYDDLPRRGMQSLREGWLPLHRQFRVKGDLALITSTPEGPAWKELSELFKGDWFQPLAHTHTHPHLSSLSPEEIHHEFTMCNRLLRERTGIAVLGLVYPFGKFNATAISVASQFYLGSRKCDSGANAPEQCNYHGIDSEFLIGTTTSEEVERWLSHAVENEQWLVTTGHAIAGIDDGWEPVPKLVYEYQFARIGELVAKGTVWNDHFINVLKYLIERNNTHVVVRSHSGRSIVVNLEVEPILNQGLLDFPLTIEMEVPEGWRQSVHIRQHSRHGITAITRRSGRSLIMFEAIPGRGEIVLSPS
jgi:peptidoglycan/xylan/chitin deacetylase (PgdA/CDA1 family)